MFNKQSRQPVKAVTVEPNRALLFRLF